MGPHAVSLSLPLGVHGAGDGPAPGLRWCPSCGTCRAPHPGPPSLFRADALALSSPRVQKLQKQQLALCGHGRCLCKRGGVVLFVLFFGVYSGGPGWRLAEGVTLRAVGNVAGQRRPLVARGRSVVMDDQRGHGMVLLVGLGPCFIQLPCPKGTYSATFLGLRKSMSRLLMDPRESGEVGFSIRGGGGGKKRAKLTGPLISY